MSKTINIFLAGMQHHHFRAEVQSGFAGYMGHTVSLRKEDDNRWDIGKAVAAYLDFEMLAYVTGGDRDKKRIRKLMDQMGRNQIRGRIVAFIKARTKNESDMLKIEVSAPDELPLQDELPEEKDWSAWMWNGPVLPLDEEVNQLHAVMDEVLELLRDGEPLDDYMQRGLDKMAELSWADISQEASRGYSGILSLLTLGADQYPEMEMAAVRVQQMMTHIGSPDVREKIYNRMLKNAGTDLVKQIITAQKYTLESLSPQISQTLVNMMANDAQGMVARIWYLEMPLQVLNGVMCSLTYLLRLLQDNGMELMQPHVPIEDRLIEVGKLMASCKGMPTEFCKNICGLIATNVPLLDERDLERLRLASKGTPQIGIQINHSVVSGNNMADNITSGQDGEMPVPPLKALPVKEIQKLLTDRSDTLKP